MSLYRLKARLYFGPYDSEERHYSVIAESEFEAMLTVVEWAMEVGRKKNRVQPKQSEYPSRWRRPVNVTELEVIECPVR